MNDFEPYANETDVLQLGRLQIENRLDRISITGDIDLTADEAGLELARALKRVLDATVAQLEAMELPHALPPAPTTRVPNPFQ